MGNKYRETVDKMYLEAKKRSKFEMFLARIFGKKISTTDYGDLNCKVITYIWRDKFYVHEIKHWR